MPAARLRHRRRSFAINETQALREKLEPEMGVMDGRIQPDQRVLELGKIGLHGRGRVRV